MKIRPLALAGTALLGTIALAGCGNQEQYKAARNTVAEQATSGALQLLQQRPGMSATEACNIAADKNTKRAIQIFHNIPMTDTFKSLRYTYNNFEFTDTIKACVAKVNAIKGIRNSALNTTSLTRLASQRLNFIAKA